MTGARFRWVVGALAVLTLALWAGKPTAQQSGAPLVVGWAEILPLFDADADGNPTGFGAEVIRAIADRADLEIVFRKYPDAQSMIRAQADGETDLLPGIATLPILERSTVFSDPVAETHIRVFVRSEDALNLDLATLEGVRIGHPVVALGAGEADLLARNVSVPGKVGMPAVTDLLSGRIDALISADAVSIANAHALRVDHRIAPVGKSLRRFDRVVSVNRQHAGLLEPINAAIAALEADGTLPDLRARAFIDVPASIPDVLTVGVNPFPPFNIVNPDGSFTGFSVETIRDLGELAGLNLEFVQITGEEWAAGPGPGRYDLITQAGISDERRERMDFTLPVQRTEFMAFTRTGDSIDVDGVESLREVRLGVEQANLARRLVEREGLTPSVFEGREALLQALLGGQVDVIVFPQQAMLATAAEAGAESEINAVTPPIFVVERAPALRFGLGEVRERLNAVIPGYLISQEHLDELERWFGNQRHWSDAAFRWVIYSTLALVAAVLMGMAALIFLRRRAEETRRVRFVSELVDRLPLGLLSISPDGVIQFSNKEMRRQTPGGEQVLAVGQPYREAVKHLLDHGIVRSEDRSTEEMLRYMTEEKLVDGARVEFTMQDGGTVVRTTQKLSNGDTLIIRNDVSEDRWIRRELDTQSRRLHALLDAAQSGIIGMTREGRIGFINPTARHMLGGLMQVPPLDWPADLSFLDREDLTPMEASRSPLHRALVGQVLRGETSLLSRGGRGEPRYVRVSSASIDEAESADIGTVLILDDVSEEEQNRQVVERTSRLEALGQLTGGIAHDFNNLLSTIEYSLLLSDREQAADKRKQYTETAISSVRRGAELTGRLLAFAKRQPGIQRSVQVTDILADFEKLAAPVIEENISLRFSMESADLLVHCDVGQLENALLNLVLNARDAILRSGKGSRIVVRARGVSEINVDRELLREDTGSHIATSLLAETEQQRDLDETHAHRYVELSVTDDGPGMSDEVKRRAIDPFFTTKDSNSGTGLGLSMVYGFIQQADGELRIYSEEGHGTTVRVLVPRGAADGAREGPVERMAIAQGGGETILLVDDELPLVMMMGEAIEAIGYVVETARNAAEALELLEDTPSIQLMITDVVMPGEIGGFELARQARAMRPDLKVIYTSGYTGFTDEEMGEVIAPLLQKPSAPGVLAETIRAVLDGKG